VNGTAAQEFEAIFAQAQKPGADQELLEELARVSLDAGEEDRALLIIRDAADRWHDPRLWQWTGILERSLDEHEEALRAFEVAAAIDPTNASIAHGHARVALEAGMPSTDLFRSALQLSPTDGEILLGYAAAMLASGKGEQAEAVLDQALARSPFWLQGHAQLAQLRSKLGKRGLATRSVERAIDSNPDAEALWSTLFGILLSAQNFEALEDAIARASTSSIPSPLRLSYGSIAAAELGRTDDADRLFGQMSDDLRSSVEVWRIRHLLRAGRIAEAVAALDRQLEGDGAAAFWPYASIAWRLAGDPRSDWLEGDSDRLVSVFDLTPDLPGIGELETALRTLHRSEGQYLDQSVRGGSQTDGPLFTRVDPSIRALRAAIVGAVRWHIEQLPSFDERHPLLGKARDRRLRFSGSWSVLLRGGGHHSNHVHPEGWISSAFYVALPKRAEGGDQHAGWLTLGEPQKELGIDLPPFRYVEPRVGQLVLFPSWMWHGTVPFQEGERLTAAFDVRPPI
jgi:tetratricopeptide (TPR) repeat protein